MTHKIRVLNSIEEANRNQWNHVVENASLGSMYHRYEWVRAIENGTSRQPKHLIVSKKENPVGILPNVVSPIGPVQRLDSIIPGFGGPLASTDEEKTIELLLKAVPEICDGKLLFSRFRTLDLEYIRYYDLFYEYGYDLDVNHCRFTIDLTDDWETILSNMSRTRRRNFRRGHDHDFSVTDVELTDESLSSFYEDHALVMKRSGISGISKSFLLSLQEFDDRVKLFSLAVDGQPSGSIICHLDDEQSTIHYAYSGIREEWFGNHASELLHEHAIRYGIANNYNWYDLRRTAPDFRDGLFQFKDQFGGQSKPLLTWERGCPKFMHYALKAGREVSARFFD